MALFLGSAAAAWATTPRPFAPVWVYPPTGVIAPVQSSPTVYNDVVYAGSDDGRLYAINASGGAAGTLLPGFPVVVDGAIKGRPAIYGETGQERVYVATTAGTLYAFRLDGTAVWSQSLTHGQPLVSTPAVRSGYVYVTASNGRIFRRSIADGSDAGGLTYGRAIMTRLPQAEAVPPASNYLPVDDASGFFNAGRVRIVSPGPLGDLVASDYTYSGRNLNVHPNRLLNITPVGIGAGVVSHPAGSRVSGFGPGASADSSPAVPGSDTATLLIAALQSAGAPANGPDFGGRNLVGLRAEGVGLVPQWEMSYGARITGAPVVDEQTGSLYVGAWESETDPTAGSRLYCLHASNGQPCDDWGGRGYYAIPHGALQAGPWLSVASQSLLFGATDGTLYGLSTATGTDRFAPTHLDGMAGEFDATPLVIRDHVYIGSHSGRFYSISMSDPNDYEVYVDPSGAALDTSPSSSGTRTRGGIVVIGSAAGRILAFNTE